MQGIPGAWEKCFWLVDQQEYFQLEFFEFLRPKSKPRSQDWRPCDVGYNMMGIAVRDFDQVLRSAAESLGDTTPGLSGDAGNRRGYLQDPEGNWLVLYERDPIQDIDVCQHDARRPEIPAVVRSMRASVPDLEQARRTYVDALGFEVVENYQLHADEDEAHWGLGGATIERLLVRTANFLLELVSYQQPEAGPWPEGYSIADQGFMNIALGYRDREHYNADFRRAVDEGMKPNGEVLDAGIFRVMYLNDDRGFSVEMLFARKALWAVSGFVPSVPYVEAEVDIAAPVATVWESLTDHAGLGRWSVFEGAVIRPGDDNRNGPGCIRELSAPGLRFLEEVTAWQEGSHYTYRLLKGAPLKRHQGNVFVRGEGDNTRVRWAISFESRIPFTGKVTAYVLKLLLQRALLTLKASLESQREEC